MNHLDDTDTNDVSTMPHALFFPNGNMVPDSIAQTRGNACNRAEKLLRLTWPQISLLGYRVLPHNEL